MLYLLNTTFKSCQPFQSIHFLIKQKFTCFLKILDLLKIHPNNFIKIIIIILFNLINQNRHILSIKLIKISFIFINKLINFNLILS